jgi:hypothetical protein
MKLFAYLSALLITTGAIFGIIDYAKAKNNGTFDQLYVEEPTEDVAPVKNEPLVNNKVAKKETMLAKNVEPKENLLKKIEPKTTPPTPLKAVSKPKPVKVSAKPKEMKQPKAPVEDVMEQPIIIRPDDEKIVDDSKKEVAIAPTPTPRKIDYRDFGRGSIRPKRIKAPAVKPVVLKLKEE